MLNISYREGISETLDILNHMDASYIEKIPKKFMNFLLENQIENYEVNFDHSKKLNEINLKEKTKDILGLIYLRYWCNENQKSDYLKLLNENEKKYQLEARKKYSPDNIFKKDVKTEIKEISVNEQTDSKDKQLVMYKESFLVKIKKTILKLFSK